MANLVDELKKNPEMEKYLEDHATYFVEHGQLTPGYKHVRDEIEEAKDKEIQKR